MALAGLLLGLTPPARSAPPAEPPWASLAATVFQTYGKDEGLPHPLVTALAQDGEGFIWASTQGGLARWDGYRFRTYRLGPEATSAGWVEALHADPQGRLWVFDAVGGLELYDRTQDRFLGMASARRVLGAGYVRSLTDDGAGGLLIGAGRDLYRFDPATRALTAVRHADDDPGSLPYGRVQAILQGRDGRLWVGGDFGLVRRDAGSGAFIPVRFPRAASSGGPVSVRALFEDEGGRLWIGTALNGALVLDRGAGTPRPIEARNRGPPLLASGSINAISPAGAEEVWLAVDGGGIVAVSETTGATRRIEHDATLASSLPHAEVTAMLRDRAGSVWIGGYGGLSRHSPANDAVLTVFGGSIRRNGVSAPDVNVVLPARDGTIWLGFVSGGVDIVDPARGRVGALRPDAQRPADALPKAPVYAMAQDDAGDVFIGTMRGLYRVARAGRRVALVHVPGRDPHGPINALLIRGRDLWIAGAIDGLWTIDTGGGAMAHGGGPLPGLDPRLAALQPDRENALWVGDFSGLDRVDLATRSADRITPDPADPGALPSSPVSSLLIDDNGRLWVGTLGGGVAVLIGRGAGGKPRFRRIGLVDGLPTLNIGKLLMDGRGRVWASTDDGLAVIDPQTFAARALRLADGVAIRNYWVGAGAVTPGGALLFGGEGGLTVVRPERLLWREDPPPLVATEARIGGEMVSAERFNGPGPNAPLVVAPRANRVAVEFAALDYTAPDRNLYAFKLDGFDQDWTYRDSRHRTAGYTNLPPGRYTLRVRGSNRYGVWSPRELRVPIRVTPAWYQTLWFKVLAVALASGAVLGLVHARTVYLRRRERALERQIEERTLDLELAAERLRVANADLESANGRLAELAHRDPLTGLINRRRFFELAAEQLALARRHQRPCGVLMIDLDHFKRINDTYGHAAGDEALRAAADCVVATVREIDIIARFGGEELAVLLPETDAPGARLIAERVRSALAALEIAFEGRVIRITASVGVAAWSASEGGIEAALDRADAALYRVKQAGRDGVAMEPPAAPVDVDPA